MTDEPSFYSSEVDLRASRRVWGPARNHYQSTTSGGRIRPYNRRRRPIVRRVIKKRRVI
jgi:hypothetical protein